MRLFAIVFISQCFVWDMFQRAAGLEESVSHDLDLRPYFHVLSPCGAAQQQFAPPEENCTQFYADSNPFLDGVDIVSGGIEFALPVTGFYNITVAGASGGKGVCSREAAGKGRLITVSGVFIEAVESVAVIIGRRGTSACETVPFHPACQLSEEGNANFSVECSKLFSDMSLLFDGGGGGGGYSQFRSGQLFWTAGGGGGAGAFEGDGLPSNANAAFASIGPMNGVGSVNVSAGVGGAGATTSSFPQDGNFLGRNGLRNEGGDDCLIVSDNDGLFPNTVGGFGGGGGGCGNGGGGGGFIGGDVVAFGNSSAGQGGVSAVPSVDAVIQNELNDEEDGFVSLFLDGCMCAHRCIPDFDQLTFRCACPANSSVSTSGLDCITSNVLPDAEGTITDSVLDGIGSVQAELTVLNATVTLYSMEVEFEGVSTRTFSTQRTALSDTCLLVLIFGVSVVGVSEIVRIGGAGASVQSFLVSNASSSAVYTSVLDSPIQVSAIDIVGVDAECQAKVSWNISINTDPLPSSRTSIFQLSTLLPEFLATCERSEACPSLALVPSPIPPPLDVALLSGLLVGGVAAGGVSLLTVLLIGCYIWYRRKKMHVTLSDIRRPKPSQYRHYEMLPLESASKMQPLLRQYEAVESYEFHYVNDQDEVHARLKRLQPKHGVRECAVTGSHNLEADALSWSRKDFMFIRKLGTGRYGEIFLMQTKAKLNGVPVAVKTLQSDSSESEEAFFKEIDLMKTLHHPNIVSFLGFCKESSGDLAAPPLMVLEYMALGDLLNLLIANRPEPSEESNLDVNLMCSFAADVARALLYLSDTGIVHGDVAARNILVSQDLVAKLSDFRLSGKSDQGESMNKMLPVRWMAPEMLQQKSHLCNMQTDIWAYGVLLWEMVTYGEHPYAQMETPEIMKVAGKGKLKLTCPANCPQVFTTAIDGCHQYEPSSRIGFQQLLQLFEDDK